MENDKLGGAMKKVCFIALFILMIFNLISCTSEKAAPSDAAVEKQVFTSGEEDSKYVELTQINNSLWVHTTYADYQGSRTPSNGMVVDTSEGLVMIDTPWNNEQTEELIKLAKEKLNKDFVLAIVTHAHADRIGGIETLRENKIEVRSTEMTAQLAKENGFAEPSPKLDKEPVIKYGDIDMEVFYPGKGHSSDNITVWIPKYKLLFGGCLIKAVESESLGSTTDANVVEWPASIQKVKEKYADINTVIPGHGNWGGIELIEHTLDLLSK